MNELVGPYRNLLIAAQQQLADAEQKIKEEYQSSNLRKTVWVEILIENRNKLKLVLDQIKAIDILI